MPLHSHTSRSHPARVAAGIDQHDGGRPRDFYHVAASNLLLPPPRTHFSRLPRLASPAIKAACQAVRLSSCQAVWPSGPCLQMRAICPPSLSYGIIVLGAGSTTVLAAYQSVTQPDNRFVDQHGGHWTSHSGYLEQLRNKVWPTVWTRHSCSVLVYHLLLGCPPSACLFSPPYSFPRGRKREMAASRSLHTPSR